MLRRSVTVLTSPLRVFRGLVLASLGVMLWAVAAVAEPLTFPDLFKSRLVAAGDTKLYIRSAGTGPAVVLLHGYGETGDMWVPLANELVSTHTVIVPDLRGLGLSERAEKGFEKKNQANDIIAVMDALQVAKADVVAHDIGNMVAYALAAQHPERVNKLIMMDAPVPGVGPWEDILKNPLLWHFRFGGPDMERLVSGRERIEYCGTVRISSIRLGLPVRMTLDHGQSSPMGNHGSTPARIRSALDRRPRSSRTNSILRRSVSLSRQ